MPQMMPRKRTILGGTLAVGLIAGIYFSDLLPHLGSGIGLGTGGDGMSGKPDTQNVSVTAGDEAKSKDESDSADHSKELKPQRTDEAPPDDVLTILVEDRHYAVWRMTRKGNGYFPAELEKVVALALKAEPNDDGVRVRIIRSKSARVTAWKALQEGLVQAGVPAEAILLPKDLAE